LPVHRTTEHRRFAAKKGDFVPHHRKSTALSRIVLLAALTTLSAIAQATVIGVNLGTSAPPATVGPYTMMPFNMGPQNAIADGTTVAATPFTPIGGRIQFSPITTKFSVPVTWFTWSNGYTGAVFKFTGDAGGTVGTLTPPPQTGAIYFYYEGYFLATSQVTVTTNLGGVVGPILVQGFGGANGIGFYSTDPAEWITSIVITSDDPAFAVAEFGIAPGTAAAAAAPIPTLSQWNLLIMATVLALGGVGLARRRILMRRR
jgi:hypothetical protein